MSRLCFKNSELGEQDDNTNITNLNAFALTAREGRTREPLDILGGETLVKLTNTDTNGAAAIFHQTLPPEAGPPLHRHSREDEWFYVLDGEITAEIDGDRTVLREGGSAFAPRGTAHTIHDFGDASEKFSKLEWTSITCIPRAHRARRQTACQLPSMAICCKSCLGPPFRT
jgi:quercetin dioxygenase-like cupin family protein